ncbi:MAG: PAS domain-containing protein, partial [Desulfamplus sp.]|nr:PAS domain-containing protein [Desulfamplus sp.]
MITKEQGDYLSNLNEELLGKINTLTVELEIARLEFIQIFDAVSDPLWVIDNEYNLIHINRAFLKLLKID